MGGLRQPEFETDPELHRCGMEGFIHVNLGYLWKEAIFSQAESAGRLQQLTKTGGLLWDAATDSYVDFLNGDAEAIVRKPHVIGIRRKELVEQPGCLPARGLAGCSTTVRRFSGLSQRTTRAYCGVDGS